MAFLGENMTPIGGNSRSGIDPTQNAPMGWAYQSATDDLETVQVTGYFDTFNAVLVAGQFIYVFLTDGKFIITVASVDRLLKQVDVDVDSFNPGGVTGPPTSTPNAIATFVDSTGQSIQSVGNALVVDDGTDVILSLKSPGSSGGAELRFQDDTGTTKFILLYDQFSQTTDFVNEASGDLQIINNFSNTNFSLLDSSKVFEFRGNSHVDTDPLLFWESGGVAMEWFLGDAAPEGVVTAVPGSIFIKIDGVDSGLFLKKNAGPSANPNNWVELGDVFGPDLSTDNALVRWDGTTGTLIKDSSRLKYTQDTDDSLLTIDSGTVDGSASLELLDSSGDILIALLASESTGAGFLVHEGAAGFRVQIFDGDLFLQVRTKGKVIHLDGETNFDTDPLLLLDNGGLNGASANFFIGARNPLNIVTGVGGDLHLNPSGLTSGMSLNVGSTSNTTDWLRFILSTLTSVDADTMLRFSDTSGERITQTNEMKYVTAGGSRQLRMRTGGTGGSANIFLQTNVGSNRLEFVYDQDDSQSRIESNATVGFTISSAVADAIFNIRTLAGDDLVLQNNTTFDNDGTLNRIRVAVPMATGAVEIDLQNDASQSLFKLSFVQGTGVSQLLHNGAGDFIFDSVNADIVQILGTAAKSFQIRGELHAEANALMSWETQDVTTGTAADFFLIKDAPEGNIAAVSGSLALRANLNMSALYVKQSAGSGSSSWFKVSMNPATIIEIDSQSEFNALFTANEFTLTEDITLILKASINSSGRFVIPEGFILSIFTPGVAGLEWDYNGTGTLFSGAGGLQLRSIATLTGSSTGKLMDISGSESTIALTETVFNDWDDLGSKTGGLFALERCIFSNIEAGFVIEDCDFIFNTMTSISPAASTPLIEWLGRLTPRAGGVFHSTGPFNPQALIRIDPGINAGTTLAVSNTDYSDTVGLFDTTVPVVAGAFTVVADNSVPSTASTVIDNGSGIARFPHAALTNPLSVGQVVTLAGFASYLGNQIVTVINALYFETALTFVGGESGNFLSNSVTMTDTATALSDGNTLVIDTTFSTDYDGGGTVYGKTVNSFKLDRIFTVTKTGTWSTAGIDETDPRIGASDNANFIDSQHIMSASVSGNAETTVFSANNTFTDIIFGTAGTALVSASSTERWKLIDEINGIYEYFGNGPFKGNIDFAYTIQTDGGAGASDFFTVQWFIDTGSGFVELDDVVLVTSAMNNSSKLMGAPVPVRAVKGDQIKSQISRTPVGPGNDIICSFAAVCITQPN